MPAMTRRCWPSSGEKRISTPSSRRRVDGVEVDAAARRKFDFHEVRGRRSTSTLLAGVLPSTGARRHAARRVSAFAGTATAAGTVPEPAPQAGRPREVVGLAADSAVCRRGGRHCRVTLVGDGWRKGPSVVFIFFYPLFPLRPGLCRRPLHRRWALADSAAGGPHCIRRLASNGASSAGGAGTCFGSRFTPSLPRLFFSNGNSMRNWGISRAA